MAQAVHTEDMQLAWLTPANQQLHKNRKIFKAFFLIRKLGLDFLVYPESASTRLLIQQHTICHKQKKHWDLVVGSEGETDIIAGKLRKNALENCPKQE